MTAERHIPRRSYQIVTEQLDGIGPDEVPGDTIPTFFPSIDKTLGGGFRRGDLAILGGDVGSGKSALALSFAIRTASAGNEVVFLSGEMNEDRLVERALAIESRITVEQLRSGKLSEGDRAQVGATALRLDKLPLRIHGISGRSFDEVLDAITDNLPALLVVDCLQLLPAPNVKPSQVEDDASALRALKAFALSKQVACLAISQLPDLDPGRKNPRPTLDDYGTLGSIKQHADIVLSIFREEMYGPRVGIAGASELIVAKNRNGATGFVDLFFNRQWMRFEDMLDPEVASRPKV
jgi:replicative DNA helicase